MSNTTYEGSIKSMVDLPETECPKSTQRYPLDNTGGCHMLSQAIPYQKHMGRLTKRLLELHRESNGDQQLQGGAGKQ